MKRVFDVFFSFVALSIFCFSMLIIILLLKLRERHGIFFKQERIGLGQRPFQILKFQTMLNAIPTRTGAILRFWLYLL